jgi:glycopeptide antibiotics resistance protein
MNLEVKEYFQKKKQEKDEEKQKSNKKLMMKFETCVYCLLLYFLTLFSCFLFSTRKK